MESDSTTTIGCLKQSPDDSDVNDAGRVPPQIGSSKSETNVRDVMDDTGIQAH
jgi:hypothetical protein